jgi:hypothetical protein
MRKMPLLVLTSLVLLAAPALAKNGDREIDGGLDIAMEPASGFGNTVGPAVGFGVELQNDVQVRGDLSYYNWSHSVSGVDVSYRRIPVSGSVRKYFPVQGSPLRAFAQGGAELSFDHAEAAATLPVLGTVKSSDSSVHFGLVIGGGAEYPINKQLGAQATLKYRIETDGYLIFGLGLVYHL